MYSQHKNKLLTALITGGLLLSPQVFSADAKKAKKSKTGLSGKFSASFTSSAGNTNKSKMKTNLMAVYRTNTPWQHKAFGSLIITELGKKRDAKKRTTKNRTILRYTGAYVLDKNNVVAAFVGRETDKQAKLKSQLIVGLGYERRNLGTENHRFTAGIGAGSLAIKYTDGTPNLPSAAALRGTLEYNGKITDKISLNEKFVVLASDDFNRRRMTSSLDYAITEKVSISLDHEVTIDSVIPRTALDKRDNETTLSFNMKF
jgi:putative salt-induced outer membrane protein YdiY